MNPFGSQAEAPKPKRGRGRPRGTKNSTKKVSTQPLVFKVNTHVPVVHNLGQNSTVTHPQSDNGVTNVTIQPGHPIICNYNYYLAPNHPIPMPTQHNLEPRSGNKSQESQRLEETNSDAQNSHDPNQRRGNTAANVQNQEQNCEQLSSSNMQTVETEDFFNAIKTASLGANSHMYQTFLELMRNFNLEKIDYPNLASQVNALFGSFPELLDRFYDSYCPPCVDCGGYDEQQLLIGNTVTISNSEQQELSNRKPSVLAQSASNISEYVQHGIPEEIFTSQDAYSGRSDELGRLDQNDKKTIFELALEWLHDVRNHLGTGSPILKKVSEELDSFYAAKKYRDDVMEFGGNAEEAERAEKWYEEWRICVSKSLNRNFKHLPLHLLRTMQNYFTSENIYIDVFGKGIETTPLSMESRSSKPQTDPIVITIDDDEDEEPGMRSLVPPLVILDEDEYTDQQLTTLEVNEDTNGQSTNLDDHDQDTDQELTNLDEQDQETDQELSTLVRDEATDQQLTTLVENERSDERLTISVEDDGAGQQLTNLVGDEDTGGQTTALNEDIGRQLTTLVEDEGTDLQLTTLNKDEDQSAQIFDEISMFCVLDSDSPRQLCALPLQKHCQDRWVYEICSTLSPILIKIKSLRNFIYNNLHVTLLKYDKDDCRSLEEESERKAVATLECESEDELMENEIGTNYAMRPATFRPDECLTRTPLCKEVLNDEYFSVAHRNKFLGIMRSKEEERMDDYEDARFEVDMMLHRSARTLEVMKEVETKISDMSDDELKNFQLGKELGGRSILHQHTLKLLYSREDQTMITTGLQRLPALFVPGVRKVLSVREREWSEFKARWNDFISADLEKYQRKKKFYSDRRTQKLKRQLLGQNMGSGGKRFKKHE